MRLRRGKFGYQEGGKEGTLGIKCAQKRAFLNNLGEQAFLQNTDFLDEADLIRYMLSLRVLGMKFARRGERRSSS